MKKVMPFVLVMISCISGFSQVASLSKVAISNAPTNSMFWSTTDHDFGKIEVGVPVTAEFTFKNSGSQPIVITEVKADCGCTVSSYTKKPVLPGEDGIIKATFNAAKAGAFRKGLTVMTNSGEEPVRLWFKGEVMVGNN